ncbi:MAG: MerR family transcriptional regulator [Acidimicrobiales bacterium mtb01]|nr:MerR family transcriptional regulator [Actinomycetota bacterium]TEX45175.1 MAG: MerR family transcriptional regulator [Acidimicrobiales bacterium mtb01]
MNSRSTAERPYLSIGEVLGLLLEEFPDVTISKIRFLESQGLIVPERTASGYRKFYDDDVERLRFILREQRENFLPLRVIKDRLDTPPHGLERDDEPIESTIEPSAPAHPSSRANKTAPVIVDKTPKRPAPPDPSDSIGRPATYTRAEILQTSGLDEATLAELESFGLVTPRADGRSVGGQPLFDEHDLALAEVARGFVDAGLDVRHLKAWKIAAEREAGLFEQRVLPILRRRAPDSRFEANALLDDLTELGGRLRAILLARSLGSLRDPR